MNLNSEHLLGFFVRVSFTFPADCVISALGISVWLPLDHREGFGNAVVQVEAS